MNQTSEPIEPTEPIEPIEPIEPAEFVCESDVREAIRMGRTIAVGEKTIVTPAARDLASGADVFVDV